MNLESAKYGADYKLQYASQKGFCEDLDEGKYSFPLIHALRSNPDNTELNELLHERRMKGYMPREAKEIILEHMRRAGSMKYTEAVLEDLHESIEKGVAGLEEQFHKPNWVLRLLIFKLKVTS